jgi:hypothetical protein
MSIQAIFDEYQRLTELSGLTLNANKTELLVCRSNYNHANDGRGFQPRGNAPENQQAMPDYQRAMPDHYHQAEDGSTTFNILYNNVMVQIKSVDIVKICGIFFSKVEHESLKKNIVEKIEKLKKQLMIWKGRSLNMLAKILIIKSYGLSQIIYQMQCLEIPVTYLKEIESIMYNFIWTKAGSVQSKHVERIARKNIIKPLNLGGFGMINIHSLDASLKIKQVTRASVSNHPIGLAQGSLNDLLTPFHNLTGTKEAVLKNAHSVIDKYAMDVIKNINVETNVHECNSWIQCINTVGLLKAYKLVGIPLLYAKQLESVGKDCLIKVIDVLSIDNHPLVTKARYILQSIRKINPMLPNFIKLTQGLNAPNVIQAIFDGFKSVKINQSTPSKDIRIILDNRTFGANQVIEPKIIPLLDKPKLLVSLATLKKVTNVKHKNTMLRILNGDIFCKERLFRFKMIDNNRCDRCGDIETSQHMLIDCPDANKIWSHLRNILMTINIEFKVDIYNVLNIGDFTNDQAIISIVAEINSYNSQPNRPTDTPRQKIASIIKSMVRKEKLYAHQQKSFKKFNKFWRKLENIDL